MKKVLIDLNIILDMITKRKDHEAAIAIYDLCIKRKIKGYVGSHEITTLAYFLKKEKLKGKQRKKIINNILDTLSVLSAHEKILRTALDSPINDYEDAVLDELAKKESIDYIITRDLQDFKNSNNVIYSAVEALEALESDI